MRTVGDVMSKRPSSIDCNEVLEDAAALMADRGVHHLVVTDRGRLVGVLSDRDLLRFECSKRVSPTVVAVAEAMCHDPIIAGPDEALSVVAARMATTCSDAAVVLDDGSVIGIFTVTDALRLLAADDRLRVLPGPLLAVSEGGAR
jgi:acetoin utilization protein AcuB